MNLNSFKSGHFLSMLLLLSASVLIIGCKPKYTRQAGSENLSYPGQESIYRANQLMIKQNSEAIRAQAVKMGWNLTETGTGVFYQLILNAKNGFDNKIIPGDRVSLSYKISLLDGTECYSSTKNGLKQFVVEKSEAEPGLHEVVQFLHAGDSALVILPPHRAFGLSGDGSRIPPRAILVYEIRVDSVAKRLNN